MTRVDFQFLGEPVLIFKDGQLSIDPKIGLSRFGPHCAITDDLTLGIIGPEKESAQLIQWIEQCKSPILGKEGYLHLIPHFPGFQRAFGTRLEMVRSLEFVIPALDLSLSLADPDPTTRFEKVVDLYCSRVEAAADAHPAPKVILLALSQELLNQCGAVHLRRALKKQPKAASKGSGQLSFFDHEQEDIEEDLEIREVYRNFRRAIKVRVMNGRIPVQLTTPKLWLNRNDSEHPATKAWNFCTGIYFKSGGIPWQWRDIPDRTCYIGISFFRPSNNPEAIQTSLAQVFTSHGEGMVVRGQSFEQDNPHESPHMPPQLAIDLMRKALQSYSMNNNNTFPERIVVHKTSKFWPDELKGLRQAASSVPYQTYVALGEYDVRFLRFMKKYPMLRGTLCTMDDASEAFLFTRGTLAIRKSYPGPYVPKPLVIAECIGDSSIERIALEILGLSKLNWNAALMANFKPITLQFAQRVGDILSAVDDNYKIAPQFRFYM